MPFSTSPNETHEELVLFFRIFMTFYFLLGMAFALFLFFLLQPCCKKHRASETEVQCLKSDVTAGPPPGGVEQPDAVWDCSDSSSLGSMSLGFV